MLRGSGTRVRWLGEVHARKCKAARGEDSRGPLIAHACMRGLCRRQDLPLGPEGHTAQQHAAARGRDAAHPGVAGAAKVVWLLLTEGRIILRETSAMAWSRQWDAPRQDARRRLPTCVNRRYVTRFPHGGGV